MTGPEGRFSKAAETSELDRLHAELAALRSQRDEWRHRHDTLARDLSEMQEAVGFAASIGSPKPPRWTAPKRKPAGAGIVTTILSDCHFDEIVKPAELGGVNAYDRPIAEQRLRRWAEKVCEVPRHYLTGVKLEGCVVMLGGDIFSGSIHDELRETNADTLPGSLLHWSEQIIAALEMVAAEYGQVHITGVVGNHGRLTRKPRAKLRARDNLDWLLYHLVARHFAGRDGVSMTVDEDPDKFVQVYDTAYLLTHGDQVRGGGGIGGVWPPIMRMVARKQQRYGRDFITVMGHWHTLIQAPSQGICLNGSTKGYDEFASICNFRPEPPQQAMWVTTPEHGVTWQAPVFVSDRKAEGW